MMIVFTFLFFLRAHADMTMPVHAMIDDAGDATVHSFKLPGNRTLQMNLHANPGHMEFNGLSMRLMCHKLHKSVNLPAMKVCGLMSIDYVSSTNALVLHLTEVNPADGSCTGKAYTSAVSLAGLCEQNNKEIKPDSFGNGKVSHPGTLAQ